MPFDPRWTVAALALGVMGMSPTPPTTKAPRPPGPWEFAAFDVARDDLMRARSATVSTACGPCNAPWAYRGRGAGRATVRAYSAARADRAWTDEFVSLLMREADWDSVGRGRLEARSCDRGHDVPWFVVTLPSGPDDAYALLDFESRWAMVFRPNHPLGAVSFDDRADSLFALMRRALPGDSMMQALASTPAARHTAPRKVNVGPSALDSDGNSILVEELPEVVGRVVPRYPEDAVRRGVEGSVMVQVLVGKDGDVKDAFARTSIPLLNDAALESVWQWRFNPARAKGEPLAVWVMVPVTFRLR